VPAPAAPAPAAPAISARSATASRTGVVRVTLTPPGADATGTVTLRRGSAIAGRRAFSARRGRSLVVRVTLTGGARAALRRARRLPVRVVVSARDADGHATTRATALVLRFT
jgi:hypothetical protein